MAAPQEEILRISIGIFTETGEKSHKFKKAFYKQQLVHAQLEPVKAKLRIHLTS